jgi:hypothetical protein
VFVFIILWNIGVLARFNLFSKVHRRVRACSDDIDVLTQVGILFGDAGDDTDGDRAASSR